MCTNTFFFTLEILSLFQEPNLQRKDQVRDAHPGDEIWLRHPGTEPLHTAHTEDILMYSVFFISFFLSTPSTTLHSMGNPAWTDFLPDAEHPQLQLLQEATKVPNPSAEGFATPSMEVFPSKQLAITGKCTLMQGRRCINDWSKGILCSTASCPLHFKGSLLESWVRRQKENIMAGISVYFGCKAEAYLFYYCSTRENQFWHRTATLQENNYTFQ